MKASDGSELLFPSLKIMLEYLRAIPKMQLDST